MRITPVMYTDSDGEFAVLIVLAYFVVVPLFVLATYALFEEVQPLLNPILENTEISCVAGLGVGVEAFGVGANYGYALAGFTGDKNGFHSLTWGYDLDLFFYSEKGYYLDGQYIYEKNYGLGPFRFYEGENGRELHFNIDFSLGLGDAEAKVGVDINYNHMVDDYVALFQKWVRKLG